MRIDRSTTLEDALQQLPHTDTRRQRIEQLRLQLAQLAPAPLRSWTLAVSPLLERLRRLRAPWANVVTAPPLSPLFVAPARTVTDDDQSRAAASNRASIMREAFAVRHVATDRQAEVHRPRVVFDRIMIVRRTSGLFGLFAGATGTPAIELSAEDLRTFIDNARALLDADGR